MTVTSQVCSISKQHNGRTIYLKPRIAAMIAEYFPLSKDTDIEYVASFDDEMETVTILKDS